MARLIYSPIASLDGYVEDEHGGFDWAAPDAEVHAFVNELERTAGTHLYGRRMYETLLYWETAGGSEHDSPASRDFAEIWRAAEKVVYSRTLPEPSSGRTRIEREFEPAGVAALKRSASRDITVGGASLAGQALAMGLLDELHMFLHPVIVGGGKRALPERVPAALELLAERRFGSGVVYLRYRVGA